MIDWLKENKTGTFLLTLGLIIVAVSAGCNGFDMGDIIKVKVPADVQRATGAPAKVPLNDAYLIKDQFVAAHDAFAKEIAGGEEFAGFLAALGTTGLEIGGAALPVGGLGMLAVTYIGGLVTRKPGDGRLIAKEKQASYNAGLAKGRELAAALTETVVG